MSLAVIFFSVYALAFFFLGWRLIGPSPLRTRGRILASIGMLIAAIAPLTPFFTRVLGMEQAWMDRVAWLGYVAIGMFCIVSTLSILRDIALVMVRLGGWLRGMIVRFTATSQTVGAPIDPERRRFLVHSSNLGILAFSGVLGGYGFWEARRDPAIVEVTVPLANLPAGLDGFRIVQFTDLHIGPTVKRDWVRMVVDRVNALSPDLIAFTGDLVDGSVPYLREDAAPLADLHAPHGTFFVTGNHEYYSGAAAWVEEVQRLGMIVLANEHRVLQHGAGRLVLAGVNDYSRRARNHLAADGNKDPHTAIAGAPTDLPRILLAHQPRSVFEASAADFDLQLSGHTHGGQFFPGNVLARLAQPYLKGLHKHDRTWIYVSQGTGYWGPPLRIGTSSEITAVTLTRSFM